MIVIQGYTSLFILTSFLLLLELVLLLAVLFVIIRDVGVWRLVVMAIVRRRWFPGTVQARELCGTDLLGAGGASHTPRVLRPALLSGAAAGGQEALSHGCCSLVTHLSITSVWTTREILSIRDKKQWISFKLLFRRWRETASINSGQSRVQKPT